MWPGRGDRLSITAAHSLLSGGGAVRLQAAAVSSATTAAVFGGAARADAAGRSALVIAAGVVLCVLPFLAAVLTARSAALAVYLCACGMIAAGWLAYAAETTVLSVPAVMALVVSAAVLIALYPAVRKRQERAAERARLAVEAAAAAQRQRKWPDLLARIGHPGVDHAGQEDSSAGYVVHLRLPGSGRVTYPALAAATERLEVAARLRRGSLRFERGDQAHQVILHVAERDVLASTVLLPAGNEPLSITGPIPVGLYQDGRVCAVTLREVATLVVGLRGSGKSNLLNVLLAQLARCPDVLIFAIDLKGGRMAAPWIQPWLARRAAGPVIDWLATDREEAERMLRALLRAVEARARSCSGGEKITPSARQPSILLVCDEVAVILGIGTGGPRLSDGGVTNATLAGLATRLVMTGRSEAIDLVMATQRGTVTMTGSADLKSQCGLRIGLGVGSEADARLIIPDDARIAADLARLRHPGCGIVQQGWDSRALPVKFFRIEHEMIGQIAERLGWLRPEPDPLLAEALGEEYRTRWSRYHVGSRRQLGSAMIPPAIAAAAVRELTAGTGRAPAESCAADDPGRQRAVAILRSAGVRGMTVRSIAEHLATDGQEVAYQTIHRWLAEEAAAGRAENASYGRWKWCPQQ
ncbi:MAG TPA: FtsK/SpoIIIE domain-containing protein [Streptosporangiaceae bacterium]|nr:FtsK/SpoIIIE domain-containing protein [Streptosporangiaceae bacterium]